MRKIKSLISSSKNSFYNSVRLAIDDKDVEALHFRIVDKVKKLLSDTSVDNSNVLSDISYIKTYSYHTNIDRAARQILCIQSRLNKLPFINKKLSKKIASFFIRRNVKKLSKSLLSKKLEDEIGIKVKSKTKNFPKEKVDIVFVASMPSYLGMALSIAPLFNKKYLILTTSKAVQGVDKQLMNKKVLIVEEYFSENLINSFHEVQNASKSYFINTLKDIQKTLTFDNTNYFKIYEDVLSNIWEFVIPQSELYYNLFTEALTSMNPDYVIGARVRRLFERASFVAARAKNVKTGIVLHSTFGSVIDDYYLTGHFDLINDAFVWGKNHKKMIEADKLSRNCNVHIVGSVNFTKEKTFINEKKGDRKFRILYAATSKGELNEIKSIVRAAQKLSNTEVIIKIHPNVQENIYDRFSKFSHVKVVTEKRPIETMMSNIDLFISTYSGSHIYAAIQGVPILLLAFDSFVKNDLREIYGLSHAKYDTIVTIKRKKLIRIINDLVLNENSTLEIIMNQQEKYINNFIHLQNRKKDVINDISKILELE
tara:strand:+ start:29931 stop:31547 length:1617 start_codon:yes stop_codon:yes gene_type:complete